ncbi:MAG TPA: class I SAM-dependent methyltransferase [Candidatus Binataceae bacterium]|nr:class I SAM-dependent methyltransferase [Candidatus Binataceae bacterium]
MDSAIEAVLREYDQRAETEMKRMREMPPAEMAKHIDEFLLPVGPATGELMNILIKEAKARTILEVGTSHGYSTVWLAEAARATGGKVITLDVHAGKQDYARNALTKAGLANHVEFKLGDARESIAALSGTIDFVLLDLWKDLYIPCFDLFYSKLASGAIVVADNMLFPEFSRKDAEEYRRHVRAKPDMQSMLLQVGSGIELSRYARGLEFK